MPTYFYSNTGNTGTGSFYGNTSASSWAYGNVTFTSNLGPPDDGMAGARAVLGVPPGSPPDVIRKAYRAKLMETHPDHGGNEEAVRRVIDAYRKLCPDAVAA